MVRQKYTCMTDGNYCVWIDKSKMRIDDFIRLERVVGFEMERSQHRIFFVWMNALGEGVVSSLN